MIFNWKEYKEKRLEDLKRVIIESELNPTLAIIQVGDIPESNLYVKNKMNACEKLGIKVSPFIFRDGSNEEELISLIDRLNKDETINGIFMQLPAPGIKNANAVINKILPIKDVDGLTEGNYLKLAYNVDGIVPCTPKGVMEMLHELNVDLDGKDVTIIGRSHLVGLPLWHLLTNKNATVSLCHSHTKDISKYTKDADIIVSAVGNHKNLITSDMVKEGSIIIDVAISKDMETGKFYGDADYENIKDKAYYITPVPGGVGQLTVLELMDNIVSTTINQKNILKLK